MLASSLNRCKTKKAMSFICKSKAEGELLLDNAEKKLGSLRKETLQSKDLDSRNISLIDVSHHEECSD